MQARHPRAIKEGNHQAQSALERGGRVTDIEGETGEIYQK